MRHLHRDLRRVGMDVIDRQQGLRTATARTTITVTIVDVPGVVIGNSDSQVQGQLLRRFERIVGLHPDEVFTIHGGDEIRIVLNRESGRGSGAILSAQIRAAVDWRNGAGFAVGVTIACAGCWDLDGHSMLANEHGSSIERWYLTERSPSGLTVRCVSSSCD